MGKTLTAKILENHLVEGKLIPGEEIGIRIDQTLTQDATGTMTYLQLEALGVKKIATELSVSYVDHNTLQTTCFNADDHLYLKSVAAKYGIIFSQAGNGICHQLHLENFGIPGKTLLGADSHTPTAGGLGMLAIGAGGLDVALAMSGAPFYLLTPRVVKVNLIGKLPAWVSAKDIILKVLQLLTVKGGVNKVLEYTGSGVKELSVPQRATITNMGAETGATSSLFPSDDKTLFFLKLQGRDKDWQPLAADSDAVYDEEIEITLDNLSPLVACPHSPDNVNTIKEIGPIKVNQVVIGSCTNSSYQDLLLVATILKGKKVHPNTSLVIAPGSRQVLLMLSKNGALDSLIESGARILEPACGPCIGMGQAPPSKGVSLRTFNRNFEGRSGTPDALVYLASPEVAVATALRGVLTDPRELGEYPRITFPSSFEKITTLFLRPETESKEAEIIKGPNIKPVPVKAPLTKNLKGEVLLKVGDNITTDHIVPAGASFLPLRSNIPALSEHVFEGIDPAFAERARQKGQGFIVGGENYGQGSSREHAALAPLYLGILAVLAKSFARIHRNNLINVGLLPLIFNNPLDYEKIETGDELFIADVHHQLLSGNLIEVKNETKNIVFLVRHDLKERQKKIILEGGAIPHFRKQLL